MCLSFDAGNLEIYDRPALDAFIQRWAAGRIGTPPDVRKED
jgi:hypothetical protein